MHSGKQWGETSTVFQNQSADVQILRINEHGFCSIHKHKHKFNLFYVIEGCLEVSVKKKGQGLTDSTILHAGESMTVAPGEYHQFRAHEDTRALEVYWTELSEDISRKSSGGSDANDQKSELL